jgi:hypothetical protein
MALTAHQQPLAAAMSPAERMQAERHSARGERPRAARHAHLAACVPEPVCKLHLHTMDLHLAVARIHDDHADCIEQKIRSVRP